MRNFFKNRIDSLKLITYTYWFLYCKFYDFFNFSISKLDLQRSNLHDRELFLYNFYIKKDLVSNFYIYLKTTKFVWVDIFVSLFTSSIFRNNNINLFRSYFRVIQTNHGFYFNFKNLLKKQSMIFFLKNTFLSGFKYIWLGLRLWILSLVIGFSIVYYSMVIRCLPFSKTLFVWIVVGMFSYWLISGFVFFVKKYQFSKFTTAIQRFWRRSYILFWLIEFSLFSVYLYLTLNANQESFYMLDQIQVFKFHLFSWRVFLYKLFPLTLLLIVGYLFLLTIKWNILSKHVLWLVLITILLTYITWVEFYQFFHVINFYGNFSWIYDVDERVWSLELEPRKTRTVNHYVMLMLILKFWHIVFIFGFWVFFMLRSLEIGRIRYPMLSANLQNFIILYLFAWVTMYPWLKFILRKYLDVPYYWFYVNNRRLGYRIFFNDIKLVYYGLVDFNKYSHLQRFKNLFNFDFFYWSVSNSDVYYSSYRKSMIKNIIVSTLNN